MNLIKNARVDEKLVNILFSDKIEQVSCENIVYEGAKIIDLRGSLLIPAGVDPHVHFNDPGFTQSEDFFTGTCSAAMGGVTTVIDMPCTALPPITTVDALENKLKNIKNKAIVDYAFWGGIRGNDIQKKAIQELWRAGVVGFKIYTVSGMKTFKALSYKQIAEVLDTFARTNLLFAFHAEDSQCIKESLAKFTKEDLKKWQNYVPSRPSAAEEIAVKAILGKVKGSRYHFVHISTQKAANLILQAKKQGKNVSFETCPHYLQFSKEDYQKLEGKLKTAPSVKNRSDRNFLRESLGKIDFIATDHAGCIWETHKKLEDFSKIYCGIPGIQTFLIYMVSEFYLKGKISYSKLVDLTSRSASKRYGLYPKKGSLRMGSDADFTIFETGEFIFDEKKLLCKGKYSPFDGEKFGCKISKVFLRGQKIFQDGKGLLGKKGFGSLIRRK